MKAKYVWVGVTLLVAAIAGFGGYYYANHHQDKAANNTTAAPAKQTPATSQTSTTPAETPKATIKSTSPEGLLNASYTRKLTDFTAWGDSPVTVVYKDFNDDGITDAFVWAKLPGTVGNSYAAVWTVDSDGKPKELWYVPDSLILGHSTWQVTANNGLENKSLNSDGTTAAVNTFHWQVSTTGQGFVLEPGA